MKFLVFFMLSATLLSGCAVQSHIHLDDRATESYLFPIKTIVVDNLASETKFGINDRVLVNGWAPAYGEFKPSLHDTLVTKIRNSMIANGEAAGRLDISVLRAGFFFEKNIADDIVFINLLTVGRERGFKCDADINIKGENSSQRITLTHEVRRSHFDDQNQTKEFIETCQTNLIRQLADVMRKSI